MLTRLLFVPLVLYGFQHPAPRSSKDVVTASYVAEKPGDGTRIVRLKLDIEKGWYVFANPVCADDFETSQTTVRVVAGNEIIAAKVLYPPPTRIVKNEDFGAYRIYEGTIMIVLTITRETPVTAVVGVQAMNDAKSLCILPARIAVKVD